MEYKALCFHNQVIFRSYWEVNAIMITLCDGGVLSAWTGTAVPISQKGYGNFAKDRENVTKFFTDLKFLRIESRK